MAKILEGRTLAKKLSQDLADQVSKLDFTPRLAIFQIGDTEESSLYIKKKKEFGSSIGVEVKHLKFSESISQEELESEIKSVNDDKAVGGIIIQLPLSKHLNFERLMEVIDVEKDVDGLTALNLKKLLNNDLSGVVPATVRAVLNLLDHYQISLEGKKATIIGRSMLVGKPVALLFLNCDATVTICHQKTENLREIVKNSDILVTAIGHPNFINRDFVGPNQIIIDIGINTISGSKMEDEIEVNRKITGDVDFEDVKDIVSAITPVPGGVGPLTVASLFQNLLDSCQIKI